MSDAPIAPLVFTLRALDAMSILQVLSMYEDEIDRAIADGKGRVTDHTSKNAIIRYRSQFIKQFTEEQLEDMKQDVKLFELINPPKDKN